MAYGRGLRNVDWEGSFLCFLLSCSSCLHTGELKAFLEWWSHAPPKPSAWPTFVYSHPPHPLLPGFASSTLTALSLRTSLLSLPGQALCILEEHYYWHLLPALRLSFMLGHLALCFTTAPVLGAPANVASCLSPLPPGEETPCKRELIEDVAFIALNSTLLITETFPPLPPKSSIYKLKPERALVGAHLSSVCVLI